MFAAISQTLAQCEDHDCNPALAGMEFLSTCVLVDDSATLEIGWSMVGGDNTCTAPAGSWAIQISFPVGSPTDGQYGVTDNSTVTGGDEFDWVYDAANFTLTGTSNTQINWLASGTISIGVTGNTDTNCSLVSSNTNILIIPNFLGGCGEAFSNQTADDVASASIGVINAALPVDLVSFTAKRKNQTSLLEWTTRVEVNNEGFDILRSEDGSRFEKIGFTKGQGTATFEKHYNFVDENPLPGINYYRLKQIDINGDATMSNIRQVSFDGPAAGKIKISPNPTIDNIIVDNIIANNIKKILITDDANRLIRTIIVDATQDIHKYDVSELSSGIYYLRFVGDDIVVTEKLIKLSF